MRKSELFAQILECVAFETEIAKEQILSKDKFQDVVDARYMLVHFCHKNGMYTTDIARMMPAGADGQHRQSAPCSGTGSCIHRAEPQLLHDAHCGRDCRPGVCRHFILARKGGKYVSFTS